jgi:hypothetical protein
MDYIVLLLTLVIVCAILKQDIITTAAIAVLFYIVISVDSKTGFASVKDSLKNVLKGALASLDGKTEGMLVQESPEEIPNTTSFVLPPPERVYPRPLDTLLLKDEREAAERYIDEHQEPQMIPADIDDSRRPFSDATNYTSPTDSDALIGNGIPIEDIMGELGEPEFYKITKARGRRAQESIIARSRTGVETYRPLYEEELRDHENRVWWENNDLELRM